MYRGAYLLRISIRNKARLILQRCTRFSELATFPSSSSTFRFTRGWMRWSLFAMKLKPGLETRFMVVLLTSLLFNNRYITFLHYLRFSVDLCHNCFLNYIFLVFSTLFFFFLVTSFYGSIVLSVSTE